LNKMPKGKIKILFLVYLLVILNLK